MVSLDVEYPFCSASKLGIENGFCSNDRMSFRNKSIPFSEKIGSCRVLNIFFFVRHCYCNHCFGNLVLG